MRGTKLNFQNFRVNRHCNRNFKKRSWRLLCGRQFLFIQVARQLDGLKLPKLPFLWKKRSATQRHGLIALRQSYRRTVSFVHLIGGCLSLVSMCPYSCFYDLIIPSLKGGENNQTNNVHSLNCGIQCGMFRNDNAKSLRQKSSRKVRVPRSA